MSNAEREARILQYWKAVELFSPQQLPRFHPNHRKEPVLRLEGETPLPWDSSRWFRAPETGHKWRFTAYCGLYKLSRVRSRLETRFGRDPNNFDRRTDGESCVFALQITSEGRPLLDTFILASCPWAVGRLNPGTAHTEWLNGFEAAAQEEKVRLAERFAIREDDEIGRELNSQPGVYVGRPIQGGDLQTEIERIARSLGVTAVLQPKNGLLRARQIKEKYQYEAEGDDFLNSFFLRDLERIAHETTDSNASAALSRFLCPDEAVPAIERCDVRTSFDALWWNTSPKLVPSSRWPAPAAQSLYFSQQFAINSLFDELPCSSPLFGINGPPGTGKTTLLRDLIAQVLVQRAGALTALPHPAAAFRDLQGHWNTAGRRQRIYLWREDLLGFEMVVASANNRAVENVTLEIPAKRAVAADYLGEINYFADFADRLLQEGKSGQQEADEAWGLIAARLGNAKNRSRFVNSFWFEDKKRPEPRTRAEKGFLRYLSTSKATASVEWKKAVAAFQSARKKETAIRNERIAAWEAVERQRTLAAECLSAQRNLQCAEMAASAAREQVEAGEGRQQDAKASRDEAVETRRRHQDFKPGLVDALFSRGAAYREWRERDRLLADAVEYREVELRHVRAECDVQRQNLREREQEIAALSADVAARQNQLSEQSQQLNGWREKLGRAFPGIERWMTDSDEREQSSPWADEIWNQARTRVLIAALHLHRAFMECVPRQVMANLNGIIDILKGKVSPEVDREALRSAWGTLFFVIPVVSTTFASFDRLFAHLGRESLGWLLIDEAGQATPQSAVGALWRSKRAVIVGDPRQLEPIVPLPFTAQQALRTHFGVEETWLPSKNSAQTLADRVSRFGTFLPSENWEEPIWVGSPLRVHRRCEKPMFTISNQIAYSEQMVYHTEELPLPLPRSCWLDVQAAESEDHWIGEEGVVLGILLSDLRRAGIDPASILLISPFRTVARKLKEIASRYDITQAGTIHVSQGKEADVVVLVLGGDPRRPGAKEWASEKPNLLNVAASRAKRRLFIIGNREEWSRHSNFSDAAALLESREEVHSQSVAGGFG